MDIMLNSIKKDVDDILCDYWCEMPAKPTDYHDDHFPIVFFTRCIHKLYFE